MTDKLSSDLLREHKGISFVGVSTCFFCHDGAGNFFLARRSDKSRDEQGRWDMGSGGLKWGVTAEENVRREVEEEYGVKPDSVTFMGYRDALRLLEDGDKTHWVALDFLVEVDRSKVYIAEPEMFDDSGWFKLSDLPSPLHSQIPLALEKYKSVFEELTTSNIPS